ncbi:16427_t:CDS:2, partial [Cetraspora pellucida]
KALKEENEVTSILYLFLTSVAGTTNEIRLWADNCSEQNKNLSFMLLKQNGYVKSLNLQELPLKALLKETQ